MDNGATAPAIDVATDPGGWEKQPEILDNGLMYNGHNFSPMNSTAEIVGDQLEHLIQMWMFIPKESLSSPVTNIIMCYPVYQNSAEPFRGHGCLGYIYQPNDTIQLTYGFRWTNGTTRGTLCTFQSPLTESSWVIFGYKLKMQDGKDHTHSKCTYTFAGNTQHTEISSTSYTSHNMSTCDGNRPGIGGQAKTGSYYFFYLKAVIHQIAIGNSANLVGSNLETSIQWFQDDLLDTLSNCPAQCKYQHYCSKSYGAKYGGDANSCLDLGGFGSWDMMNKKFYDDTNRNRPQATLKWVVTDTSKYPAQTNYGWMNYGSSAAPTTEIFTLEGSKSITLEIIATPVGDSIEVWLTNSYSTYYDIHFKIVKISSTTAQMSMKSSSYTSSADKSSGILTYTWGEPAIFAFTLEPTLETYYDKANVCFGLHPQSATASTTNRYECIYNQYFQSLHYLHQRRGSFTLQLYSSHVFFHQVKFYKYAKDIKHSLLMHAANPCYEIASSCRLALSDADYSQMISVLKTFNPALYSYTSSISPSQYVSDSSNICQGSNGVISSPNSPFCIDDCGSGTSNPSNNILHFPCDDFNAVDGDACSNTCYGAVVAAVCNDGTIQAPEGCEDGGVVNGDGCNSQCQVETGWTCSGSVPQSCTPICGDGLKKGAEACDDGNTNANDGCSATCTVETYWSCNAAEPTVCTSTCGDGGIVGSEVCDDNNVTPNDGCSATCTLEDGWACTGQPSSCSTVCGDSKVRGAEPCDDGDTNSNDGCSAVCAVETGWTCTTADPSVCTSICGDGLMRGSDVCDDSGVQAGDGCSATCSVETGWTCNGAEPTVCAPICGDGLMKGSEPCDDGNTNSNDGCKNDCTAIETGWTCPTPGSACIPTCGDGLNKGTEACDDSNTDANDGCSATCTVETYWTCTTADPSVCNGICQDGKKRGSEACDDNNSNNNDGCSTTCTVETGWSCDAAEPSVCTSVCGDKYIRAAEVCDDNNTNVNDGCSATCTVESGWTCDGLEPTSCSAICGDGLLKGSEVCDDGNTNSGDGCKNDCGLVESGYQCPTPGTACTYICGDSLVKLTETCDDGNTADGDGCYGTNCTIETGFTCPTPGSACLPICADGVKVNGEACDDSNTTPGDGCSADCKNVEVGWTCPTPGSSCTPICGDTLNHGGEQCDDGNTSPNDGCDASCNKESGFTCPSTGACSPICGDGFKKGTEACDDGNTVSTDGCKSDCTQIEDGYYCPTEGTACNTQCGDGLRAGIELCDDGSDDNIGCATGCGGVNLQTCSGGSPTTIDTCNVVCGDNMKHATELCDDGGTSTKDGCSSTCTIEAGWQCSGSPSSCSAISCGDGLVAQGSEDCDDGNIASGDGCDNSCAIENTHTCIIVSDKSICTPICGDGLKFTPEVCDDGNTANGDGCAFDCTSIETGYQCTGGTTSNKDTCTPICGDGTIISPEVCDDNNSNNTDGCPNTCNGANFGYSCSGSPSICTSTCQDGKRASDEACDDGNSQNGDGCSSLCALESGWSCFGLNPDVCGPLCGNGIVEPGQPCDDGNATDGIGCKFDCSGPITGYSCSGGNLTSPSICTTICGDGLRLSGEVCDDGNSVSYDGCAGDCNSIDHQWKCIGGSPTSKDVCEDYICGNGKTQTDEACDDGNDVTGDGCSITCQIEPGHYCIDNGLSPDFCYALCGNNKIDGSEECDDGNNLGMDGCDTNCQIEGGYACAPIVNSTKYECLPLFWPPKPEFQVPVDDENFVFKWNTTMQQVEIKSSYMNIRIDGPSEPYDLTWTAIWLSSTEMQIQVIVQSILIGGGVETLIIDFSELEPFQSTNNRGLMNPAQGTHIYTKLTPSEGAQSAASTTKTAIQVGTLTFAVAQLVAGGSMEALWGVLNTCQLIYYLALISLYLPTHVITMFKVLGFANMDLELLAQFTKLFYKAEEDVEAEEDPVNYRFENLEIGSKSLIENSADAMPILLLCLLALLYIVLVSVCSCVTKIKYIGKYLKKLLLIVKYNFIIRLMLELYLELNLASIVNIAYANPNRNTTQTVSFFIAVGILGMLVLFTISVGCFIIRNEKGIVETPDKFESQNYQVNNR